jgi:hypothetical protein
MGEERKCTRFWWESPKERVYSEDQGVDGRMESEWILGRMAWEVWIGLDWLRLGIGGDCCECGDEPLGSWAAELVG